MMELLKLSPFISMPDTIAGLLAMGASVPVGAKGKVYVEGRNDMDTTQQMGISWVIKDSDGWVPPNGEYSAWGLWPHTDPGKTHTFDGPTFNLDKIGTWMIAIVLFMNPDDPVAVASYDGALCLVEEEVPPECSTDADCPEGYVCVNGVCVPEEEVEKKFPWAPVIIGAGAVIAIAGLAAARK